MMKKILLLICLFHALIPSSLSAQQTRFYNANRIGSNWYNDICQDEDGFIWIAAYYGLYRFDGTDFKTYLHDESDSTSLSDNMVRALFVDKGKRMWVGTANGLQYYRPDFDDFHNITFQDTTVNRHVVDICQMNNGEIWSVVSGVGIFKINVESDTAVRVLDNELINNKFITSIFQDHNDNIWIGTDRQGVIRIDSRTSAIHTYARRHNINSIFEDTEKNLLVVSRNAVMVWNEQTDTLHELSCPTSEELSFRSSLLADDGSVWLGSYGQGIQQASLSNLSIHSHANVYSSFFNIDKAKITCMYKDQTGNIWLGCAFQGIMMIPKQKMAFSFWDYSLERSNESGEITTLYCDREGSIWSSIESGGISKFNSKGEVVQHVETPLTVTCLHEDSEGTFWVGTDNGIYTLDKRANKLRFSSLNDNRQAPIKSIIEDKEGNLYIILSGIGLLRHNIHTGARKLFLSEFYPKGQNLVNNWSNVIMCDSEGLIWSGHYNGLSCYDPANDRFLNVNDDEILYKSICFALIEGRGRKIWIGTNNGLFCYDPLNRTTRRFTTSDGMSNNSIRGLAEDSNGDIWCSTMQGISRLRISDNTIESYYSGNGLVDKTYGGGVYVKDQDGKIYFGGNAGITSFTPEEITQTGFDRQPHITELLINNDQSVNRNTVSGRQHVLSEKLSEASSIRLSYLDNTFTLLFSTMDFRESGNIQYEYRLKSNNSTWSKTIPGNNRITYNNLAPGRHELEVRASENGVHSASTFLEIRITRPWYQSAFAQVIYLVLLAAFAVLILITLKRKRQEEISEAKLQFFINISHDIRSPLTLILSPLENLLQKSYDNETTHALEVMHRNATRIISLINQLLDIRKIDKGRMNIHCCETDLVSYATDIVKIFEYQAQKKHIKLSLVNHQQGINVWIDRCNFDKVLINLLQNAFKYTPEGGEITLSLDTGNNSKLLDSREGYAEIMVTDSGIGLDNTQLDKIFDRFYQSDYTTSAPIGFGIGLNFCQLLVKLHHGTITASNRRDSKGSCFTIRLPLGNSHLKANEISVQQPQLQKPQESFVPDKGYNDEWRHKKERNKTNYRVLIVDDDDELRSFLKDELSRTYKVDLATNGSEGMAMAIKTVPDVVISDIMMPEMDGLTMLKLLKTNGNTNHIPVIMLTSKSEFDDRIDWLDKGADGYLSKPFNMEELHALLANTIANHIRLKGKYSGMQSQEGKIQPIKLESEDKKLMDKVISVINDNIDNPELSVEMLATEIGISRVQLHRKLKGLTGIATSDFIRNIRLRQAADMLLEQKSNISQIAYAVGFSSQSHFSTAFKKLYGVSPKEYADSQKNETS